MKMENKIQTKKEIIDFVHDYQGQGLSNIDYMALMKLYDSGYEPEVEFTSGIPYYIKLKNGFASPHSSSRSISYIKKNNRPLNWALDVTNLMNNTDSQYVIFMDWSFVDKAWAYLIIHRNQLNEKNHVLYHHFDNYLDELPDQQMISGKKQVICWQCNKDITDQPYPYWCIGEDWTRHCEECYRKKVEWAEEIRKEDNL